MVRRFVSSLTRRRFVQRTTTAIGGVVAFTLDPNTALADEHCQRQVNQQLQTSSQCNVRWGPPSCNRSCATANSPNGQWYFYWCCVCPRSCNCRPYYQQARVAQHNDGRCSGHCVSAE